MLRRLRMGLTFCGSYFGGGPATAFFSYTFCFLDLSCAFDLTFLGSLYHGVLLLELLLQFCKKQLLLFNLSLCVDESRPSILELFPIHAVHLGGLLQKLLC